ncbi:MAG TPA: hypothetical protein VI316_09595 [Candidatus Dormibacteraeota bacterium]
MRRVAAAAALIVCLLSLTAAAAPATPPILAAPPATPAGEPWWVPVGLRGETVTGLTAHGDMITVTASGHHLVSRDGGRTFAAEASPPPPALPTGVDAEVRSGADRWALSAGRVLRAVGAGGLSPDPGAPDLGRDAHLLAAPAISPGVVVAVSDAGVVWWRNGATGSWGRALVLLPQSLFVGRPAITALSAFDEPVSASIYLATAGYSTLLSNNGGQDWSRAGPGLPDSVLSLASDSAGQAVYAGTTDGLWVHHLRSLPAIPVYTGADLFNRRVGTALITLVAILAGLLVMRFGLRSRPSAA